MIDLCTLGTGGSIPMPARALASLYVRCDGHALLVDCGEGTQMQIMKLGWGFRCIEAVLLTHFHADHVSGLPGFLLAQAKANRDQPLDLYGPPGLAHVVSSLRVIAPQLPYEVRCHDLAMEPSPIRVCGLDITAFPLRHSIPCLGYDFRLPRLPRFDPDAARHLQIPVRYWGQLQRGESVEVDGRRVEACLVQGEARTGLHFLYATDTRPSGNIREFGQGADLMILEGMYGDPEKANLAHKNHHMLFREAAECARDAGAGRLLLTHYSTSMEDPESFLEETRHIFPPTDCALDLSQATLQFDRAPVLNLRPLIPPVIPVES